MDRFMLAAASYNAGAGHLIKAQRACNNARNYPEIIICLPDITGHHANETKDYVRKIVTRWYPALIFN